MIGEIIAIGDELTSGRILNTTSGFAARSLFDAGHTIRAMSTIGDTPELIGEALVQALDRADFIIVTGGLGSTDDDLTNEAVSRALNRPTLPNLTILARIRRRLLNRREAVENPLEKLAWLPDGAEAFEPESHMAGYLLVHENTPIFFLPGVPEEMRYLLVRSVLPKLDAWQTDSELRTMQRIYKVFGIAEAEINRRITALDLPEDIKIGYYPVYPDVHVSALLRSREPDRDEPRFAAACKRLEPVLGRSAYGIDEDELETVVGGLLSRAGFTLAVAESCTGGLLGHRITRVPGSSSYFLGGAIAYDNELKTEFLGLTPALLQAHGAVSEAAAEAMAIGIRNRCRSDLGVAVTGIAGPGGGTGEKPVGTVFVAIADADGAEVIRLRLRGGRHAIQTVAAHHGLDLLRRHLEDSGAGPPAVSTGR